MTGNSIFLFKELDDNDEETENHMPGTDFLISSRPCKRAGQLSEQAGSE
jgi:hypothetical protein